MKDNDPDMRTIFKDLKFGDIFNYKFRNELQCKEMDP